MYVKHNYGFRKKEINKLLRERLGYRSKIRYYKKKLLFYEQSVRLIEDELRFLEDE